MTYQEAEKLAKLYHEKVVCITYFDGEVQHYSAKNPERKNFLTKNSSGTMKVVADFTQVVVSA